ncbi:Rv3235 family protein [Streptomyces sp. NPDC048483]|uniref:Rv3235 family protein n=1 Tax=Streptomyces sp. NPDC048483 TaxID=3154927 RepID=UPI0034146325
MTSTNHPTEAGTHPAATARTSPPADTDADLSRTPGTVTEPPHSSAPAPSPRHGSDAPAAPPHGNGPPLVGGPAPRSTPLSSGPRPAPPADAATTPGTVPRPRQAPAAERTAPAADDPGTPAPRPRTDPDAATAAGHPAEPAPATRRALSSGRGPGAGPGRGPARTRPGGPSTTSRTTPGRFLPTDPPLSRPPHRTGPAGAAGRRSTTDDAATAAAATAAARLPTVGARRRAHEQRPHNWFARQLLLTLSGQRPVHALLGLTLPAAYDRLVELAPQAPLRPAARPGRLAPLPALHECGLCRPRTGVIEAFARIASGDRLRALAFRLELCPDTRWRCAAFDIGPTPAPWVPAPR